MNSPGGGLKPIIAGPVANLAWINHYFFKSPAEMLVKWLRNRGSSPVTQSGRLHLQGPIVERYLAQHASEETLVDRRISACAPGLDAELNALRQLPGVLAASAEIAALWITRQKDALRLLLRPASPYHPSSLEAQLVERLQDIELD